MAALGAVDASGATGAISDDAGGGDEYAISRAEKLHAEQGGCQRGFGGPGENGDETERGEKIDRRAERACQGISKRGSDEKKRSDFAAFEARTQSDDGEKKLPGPGGGGDFRGCEHGGQRDRSGPFREHAESEVVARSC